MPQDFVFRSARLWSNQELRSIASHFKGDIVNVSAGDDLDKEGNQYEDYFPNKSSWTITNYSPGSYRGYAGRPNELLLDLTDDLDADLANRFDVVLSHTTLEHIFDVRKAVSNLCAISRDIVIVIVPFCQVQHETQDGYKDFWRFTPTCLRFLFSENGLTPVYESESPQRDAAIYLLMVASKNPQVWKDKFPVTKVDKAGSWIGRRDRSAVGKAVRKLGSVFEG